MCTRDTCAVRSAEGLASCKVGELKHIASGEQLKHLQSQAASCDNLVLDMSDWRIIPAENMVAAFQVHDATHDEISLTRSAALLLLPICCCFLTLPSVSLDCRKPDAVFRKADDGSQVLLSCICIKIPVRQR